MALGIQTVMGKQSDQVRKGGFGRVLPQIGAAAGEEDLTALNTVGDCVRYLNSKLN